MHSFYNLLMVVLCIGHLGYAVSASSPYLSNKISSFDNMIEENFEIIKVIPFNSTIPSSITVDQVSNLVYAPSGQIIPAIICLSHVLGRYNVSSKNESDTIYPCSVIYVLDGKQNKIIDIIRLRRGERGTRYRHRLLV